MNRAPTTDPHRVTIFHLPRWAGLPSATAKNDAAKDAPNPPRGAEAPHSAFKHALNAFQTLRFHPDHSWHWAPLPSFLRRHSTRRVITWITGRQGTIAPQRALRTPSRRQSSASGTTGGYGIGTHRGAAAKGGDIVMPPPKSRWQQYQHHPLPIKLRQAKANTVPRLMVCGHLPWLPSSSTTSTRIYCPAVI